MKLYPQSAIHQLELDKIKELLQAYCKTSYALEKAGELRIHTRIEYITKELNQSHEFKLILSGGQYFPHGLALNIMKELRIRKKSLLTLAFLK
jgi:DNA mismatch repair protein MutS2